MKILLTRISPTHHRLEVIRDNGARDSAEFETKSVLVHDLIHYAVESTAGIQDGFWGTVAQGKKFSDLTYTNPVIEPIVGAFSQVVKGNASPEAFIFNINNLLQASGKSAPAWLTVDFVTKVQAKMPALLGHWNATAFSETMELEWYTGVDHS